MIETQELVLRTKALENDLLHKYSGVLDIVCGKGDEIKDNKYYFQKEAVEAVLRYMLNYKNLEELIEENIDNNIEYHKYYKNEFGDNYLENFQDRNKKVATIDLPTATGKSFVIFAAAIILYNEIDEIKRIQVIAPSKTISKQLKNKFENLIEQLSRMQEINLPELSSLHERELLSGEMAIDNIHKFYETENAQLSKEHSFGNRRGNDVLILNDEAHHIYSAEYSETTTGEKKSLKEWEKFLMNKDYGFKYIINFTATPFREQKTYLHNVIYSYSLDDAIKKGIVKDIEYHPKGDEHINRNDIETQQLSIAIDELKELKRTFRKENIKDVRPFGVVVCDSIAKADQVVEQMKSLGVPEGRVIAYTSKHLNNEPLVDDVDSTESKIDWVVSVGMLTEGWDAKNVFLLVPHEERAFQSKLLISQMVGRGLRRVEKIPEKLNELNKVLILNHRAWGDNEIQMLINKVVDTSTKIEFGTSNKYHFELHNLEKQYDTFNLKLEDNVRNIRLEEILRLTTQSFIEQQEEINYSIERKTLKKGKTTEKDRVSDETYKYKGKKDIVSWYQEHIMGTPQIKSSFENGEEFFDFIMDTEIIKKSKVKDKLHVKNLEMIEQALMEAFDDGKRGGEFEYELKTISTKDIRNETFKTNTFLEEKNKIAWYSPSTFDLKKSDQYGKLITQKKLQVKEHLRGWGDLIKEDDDALEEVVDEKFEEIDAEKYKTPLQIVRNDSVPEKQFIERIFNNINKIDAWLKSRSQGFYTIEMDDTNFNPDFLIRLKDKKTLIIEIKGDDEKKKPTAKKLVAIQENMEILNQKLKEKGLKGYEYIPFILRPKDFNVFFGEVLGQGNYNHVPEFHSELKSLLQNASKE